MGLIRFSESELVKWGPTLSIQIGLHLIILHKYHVIVCRPTHYIIVGRPKGDCPDCKVCGDIKRENPSNWKDILTLPVESTWQEVRGNLPNETHRATMCLQKKHLAGCSIEPLL